MLTESAARMGHPGAPPAHGEAKERPLRRLRIEPRGMKDFMPREELEWDESLAFGDRPRGAVAGPLTAPEGARRWPWIGGLALSLAVGYVLGWQARQVGAPPEVVTLTSDPAAPAARPPHAESALRPASEEAVTAAREALQRFVEAPADRKARYVLDAERVGPALAAYYARGDRDDGVLVGPLTALPLPDQDVRRGIVCFVARLDDLPLLAPLKREETEEGLPPVYRLDWETYVQEKEGTLRRFIFSKGEDPAWREGVFRVALSRSHLFNEQDTRLNRLGLRLATPSGVVFEPRLAIASIDPLYKRLQNEIAWNQASLATVRLVWVAKPDVPPTLELKDFFCWELAGVGGEPNPSLPPPEPGW